MREILFRGKRKDNKEWVDGWLYVHEPPLQCHYPKNYVEESKKYYILQTAFADWNMERLVEFFEVIPATVGQFTGLLDKNGVKIFEGDIVAVSIVSPTMTTNMLVQWEGSGFWLVDAGRSYMPNKNFREVIGNIHDNPELLEVTE